MEKRTDKTSAQIRHINRLVGVRYKRVGWFNMKITILKVNHRQSELALLS